MRGDCHSGKDGDVRDTYSLTSRRMLCTYHKASKSWNHRDQKPWGYTETITCGYSSQDKYVKKLKEL